MKYIEKIILKNFKRFPELELSLNEKINILIGENETGKSSILLALNLVLGGSRSQFESIGAERLLNFEAVESFLASEKKYEDLPEMFVELWLNEQNNIELNGNNNSKGVTHDGLIMECKPNEELSGEIQEILQSEDQIFPYDYYQVKFKTFQGDAYTGYRKFLRHLNIDTSLIGNDYAVREYVRNVYEAHTTGAERQKHQYEYRKSKDVYTNESLVELNERVEDYAFSLKSDPKSNLNTDLTLLESNISIDNKGKGKQCFVKTDFALSRAAGGGNVDIILLEEPENHLSHINMRKLISKIREADDRQLLIATHSNMISARLDLRNTKLLHTSSLEVISLEDLAEDTAKFFIKAPDHGILDFVLSKKVILVEGDAEYILMERFYRQVTGQNLEENDIHILSVDGTSFKRYLDIARQLEIKVAVIRDNDQNYQQNCTERYQDYASETIRIFSDADNTRHTLEVCLYLDNQDLCEGLFSEGRRTLTVQDYMLKNKTEAALALLENPEDLILPEYIEEAIRWISA